MEILFRHLIKYLTPFTSTRRDSSLVPHELASPRLGSNLSPLSQNTIDQHIRVGLVVLRRERDPESWVFISSTTHKNTHVLGDLFLKSDNDYKNRSAFGARLLVVSRSEWSLATYYAASHPYAKHESALLSLRLQNMHPWCYFVQAGDLGLEPYDAKPCNS